MRGDRYTFTLAPDQHLRPVTIDSDGFLPDHDPTNNRWTSVKRRGRNPAFPMPADATESFPKEPSRRLVAATAYPSNPAPLLSCRHEIYRPPPPTSEAQQFLAQLDVVHIMSRRNTL